MASGIRGWESGCITKERKKEKKNTPPPEISSALDRMWLGKKRDAPSFLALPFASVMILNLGPIPPLALRRNPQRVLHLPLHRRRLQRPEVLRGLSKDVLERGRLEDLVRPEDHLRT